jgi:SAM-dependent methyltransferase
MHTVSGGVNVGVSSSALKKTIDFFRPGIDYSLSEENGGYIDVLGPIDAISSRASHQVVQKKNFPRIYERIWRPVVSRMFFGLFGMGPRKERRITLEMLDVSPGNQVLDVGCGPGNYTRYLAEAGGDGLAVGADASGAMLAAGVRLSEGSNLAFVRADACALPFEDGVFDIVSCVGTIHMIESPMAALAEMMRMLAPGGRIGMMTTCGRSGAPARVRNGVTVFARDELPRALAAGGLVEIEQRVVKRAQFISARKPAEDPVGR